MAAPTFVAEYEVSSWDTTTSPKTVTPTTAAGDVLALVAAAEDSDATLGTPSGNSLTYTARGNLGTANYCRVAGWTAPDAAGATGWTLTETRAGTALRWGFTALRFSGSDGVGANASASPGGTGGPTLNITTTQANSALVVIVADWNAVDGASRTWRTVNGITPTAGNGGERVYFRNSASYTVYAAYYSDAGAAGSKTVGLSAPTGQKFAILAIEILGTASTPPVTGTGLAALTLTAVASGRPTTFGTAAASLTLDATAAGRPTTFGTGTTALTLTAAASGAPVTQGAATSALTLTATAAGHPTTQGTATAGLTLTATAAGSVTHTGAASAVLELGATSAGRVTVQGQAAAGLMLTATAAGSSEGVVIGAGSAALTLTATAAGDVTVTGVGSAGLTLTAAASGHPTTFGTGAAALTLTATAEGTTSAPPVTGAGLAALALSASVTGLVTVGGLGGASITLTAAAAGTARVEGQAAAALTLTAAGQGVRETHGAGAAVLVLTATAAGGEAFPQTEIFGTLGALVPAPGITGGAVADPDIYGVVR